MAQASAPRPSLGVDISMLERTAESISSAASLAGSDIGEEIRKMVEEQRSREASRSRSASQSSQHGQHADNININNAAFSPTTRPRRISSNRSRATSNSYANSVSDARFGIASPSESVRSAGSWSQSMLRARLAMDASMHSPAPFEPTHEPLQEGRPLDSPLAPTASMRSASHYSSHSQDRDHAVSRRVSQSSLAFSYSQENAMSRQASQASQSSFAQRYDQIAGQIEEQLQTIPHTPEPEPEQEEQYQQRHQPQYSQQEQEQHHEEHSRDVTDTPNRPHSPDTFQEAELAFKDFDGVHFNPATEEFVAVDENGDEVRRVSARTSSGSLMDAAQVLQHPLARTSSGSPMDDAQVLQNPLARRRSYGVLNPNRMSSYGPPPPESGMVYYPAPVPRMLNLPKRLSQLPAANVQAQRRTQLLNEMNQLPKEEPAPNIPKMSFDETEDTVRSRSVSQPEPPTEKLESSPPRGLLNQRMSVANIANVPPQLRASVYFEHQPIPRPYMPDVQRKHESAVATLDSILAASATAPVSAFTDHPFAGDVRKSVYAMEKPAHARKDTSTTLLTTDSPTKELKKKRSSSIGNFFRRSSGDLLDNEPRRPASRGSQMLEDTNEGGRRLWRRKSQLSLADPLERERTLAELEGKRDPNSDLVAQDEQGLDCTGKTYTDGEQIAEDFREQEALSDVDETDPIYVQPSTLLAELQVRKAQLKNRTRTAAVAYPNGMHSTLLELDAVQQIEKKKRQKQRITLAWEDPHQAALDETFNEEDDVPLGVLYASKDGMTNRKTGDARDWDRPLGLMEQREMEDTEPLSKRAERLNPGKFVRRPQQQRRASSHMHLAGAVPPPEEAAVGEEDQPQDSETLGERMTRIQDKDALDTAISDSIAKPGSRPISTFSNDVLNHFGGETKDTPAKEEEEPEEEEEETLGQRKARLQRERAASGEVAGSEQARPPLRSTNSMANLLSSNPVRAPMPARAWEGRGSQGGLLQASVANQARQKEELRNTNLRSNGALPYVGGLPPITPGYAPQTPGYVPPTPGYFPAMPGKLARRQSGLMEEVRARPANGQFVPTASSAIQFASPTAGYGQGMMMGGGAGMLPQQINAPAYWALQGGQRSSMMMPSTYAPTMMGGYGMPQQQMMGQMMYGAPQQNFGMGGMGMGMGELPLDPNQRAAIDRWRMGIATPLAPRN